MAGHLRHQDETAGATNCHLRLRIDDYGRVGNLGNCGQGFLREILFPVRVIEHCRIEKRGMVWQLTHALFHLAHWQICIFDNLQLRVSAGQLPIVLAPIAVIGYRSAH